MVVTLSLQLPRRSAFQPAPTFFRFRRKASSRINSSVGGGNDGPPKPPGNGNDNNWDDFLNPDSDESENLKKAREFMSENSLPISFGQDESEETTGDKNDDKKENDASENENSSALVGPSTSGSLLQTDMPSEEDLANNPYIDVVSKLSPSELISKFTSSAHPRVQDAVRNTILGLIGGLPKLAFETTTMTTGQRLASLMFQLQMTGYMFKNADYRLSLEQSLGTSQQSDGGFLLTGTAETDDDDENVGDLASGKVRGKLKIRYGGTKTEDNDKNTDQSEEGTDISSTSNDGIEIEADAAAYMSELRSEVSQLRDELATTRKEKDEALRKDLLLFIRTLPEQELRSLTNTMNQDVLVAMKGLVNAVMSGIGEGQIGPDTVTEQSGEAMAQLCMWQLVIGYNLRTLEVREEMKKSLTAGTEEANSDNDDVGPGDLFDPDVMQ